MAIIETYADEEGAKASRDDYNHNFDGKRATIFKMAGTTVEDHGGGGAGKFFKDEIDPAAWLVVIEDI